MSRSTDTSLAPLAAAPAAANGPSDDQRAVSAGIEALNSLDIHELRIRWRKLLRATAPAHLPRYLLLRIIAYRIQVNAFGDLDRETRRFLDSIGRELRKRRGNDSVEAKPASALVPPVPAKRSLKPGTILAREHDGVLHRVMVTEDGFAWNGAAYRSLSEVARAVTGTNWNGPLFFGLRAKPKPERRPPEQLGAPS